MTAFVAVISDDGEPSPTLPERCVTALRLPDTEGPTRHAVDGFSGAARRTRPGAVGLYASEGLAALGDVRLDGRSELVRALRAEPDYSARLDALAKPAGDLDVVVAAYSAWGTAAPDRLRGDFSFVLWDCSSRTLIAARDGMGVRPLYYASIPGGMCISNLIAAVRAHPAVSDDLNNRAVVSFLEYGWNVDTSTTTFAAIARLAPGTLLFRVGSGTAARVREHWRMPDPTPLYYRRDDEYVEHYRALLAEAVRDRITGPTTILLSGGLDSPSIAATARRVAPGIPLTAVTTRMPQVEPPDEVRLAREAAARLEIAHEVMDFEIVPTPEDPVWTPEPIDDFEAQSNERFLSELARRAPVVLKGEDGDALFTPPGLREMLRLARPGDVARRVLEYTIRHRRHPYLGFWLSRRLGLARKRRVQVRPPWLAAGAAPSLEEPPPPPNVARPEAAARLQHSIWQSIHQGADRGRGGPPVEFRWPLLDSRLIEFVFAIPPVPWCQRKFLVRRAFANELPPEIISRPKTAVNRYFEVSVEAWRRRSGGVLEPFCTRTAEFVDAGRLAETVRNGDTDAVLAAWRALMLDAWFRQTEDRTSR